jgi:GAF domain-containing protein
MSAPPDNTLADPEQLIADLQRQLAECNAERDQALQRETATTEVLQVINSSPGDLAPVYDAMLDKAMRLCEATCGHIWGGQGRAVAVRGDPDFTEWLRRQQLPRPVRGSSVDRLRQGEPFVHVLDCTAVEPYRTNPWFREFIDCSGCRTSISVPLRKDGVLLGTIALYRQQVRAFSDKQIALLQNFAAQAVIAMENARLLGETREALEQQTATAEVLQVINSSPGDLAPVFDAMIEKAMRLCEVAFGVLLTYDGSSFQTVAARGIPAEFAEFLKQPIRPAPGNAASRVVAGEAVVHITDLRTDEATRRADPARRAVIEKGGGRTQLIVALRKDNALLGIFVVYRTEVRPFTDRQIALLQNFAAQAVIAMENARLLTETREALEQQTATAEVLGVINSSPGELRPVFDAILEKAHRLCGATCGTLQFYDGETFRAVATRGVSEDFAERVRQGYLASGRSIIHPLLEGARFIQIPDWADVDDPIGQAVVELEGVRTGLLIPLRRDNTLLGMISANRREIRPFLDKEIALLENFAAQAVIAMENARLLTETREALEQQTATAEVLQVINSSPGALAPVFDAILEKAHTLCEATTGSLRIIDGDMIRTVAIRGYSGELADRFRSSFSTSGAPLVEALRDGAPLVHIIDVAERLDPISRLFAASGNRAVLVVPLRKDDGLLGMIVAGRKEARPFADKQIALLQNFAAQAVIAMENARLLTETREALEQQTATAEVLQVINSSPGDLAPVFDAILEKAHTICAVPSGTLQLYDGERFRAVATRGYPEAWAERLRQGYRAADRYIIRPLLEGVRYLQIPDWAAVDDAISQEVQLEGIHTVLAVPLRRDNTLLGMITASRHEIRPFADREIALLENFAAQSVIAMDNARLLNEIRQRQAELRVTFDNMGDGVAMFDAELRLAAWNLNFQDITELSDAFLAERPSYPAYLRALAERGEFGNVDVEAEVSRRLNQIDQQTRFEHVRPDGRIIEVRRNPVPGGGYVLIYSDATERKRAEAEIRAARDAAEKALGELQAAQASLLHAQKMAALGRMTAGIAHEIKNPLNFVNNFADLSVELLGELKDAVIADKREEVNETIEMLTGNLDRIAEHGRRADGIVKSMLEHSRGSSGDRRSVDLNALVDEALNLAYHGARAQDQNFNITLERDFDPTLQPVELVPQDVTRVFLNLIGNGFYAASKRHAAADGGFRPVLKVATRDLGDEVEIRVRDNGTGIPPDIRDKLFQPFVTTKPTGEGTGLGLSISYDIVTQQHCGTIEVDSEPGSFTEFTVRLPRSRGSARSASAA